MTYVTGLMRLLSSALFFYLRHTLIILAVPVPKKGVFLPRS